MRAEGRESDEARRAAIALVLNGCIDLLATLSPSEATEAIRSLVIVDHLIETGNRPERRRKRRA